jgi:hypothetical protein
MEDELSLDELLISLIVSCLRESEGFLKYEISLKFEARMDKEGNIEAQNFIVRNGNEVIKPVAVKPDVTH